MLFINYFTSNYEEIMDNYLLPSLIGWELPYYTDRVKDLGSWDKNTDYKPIFIKQCLEKFKTNLVWIDADAIVKRFPSLFWIIPKEYDIGIHYMDDKLYIPNGHRITLLSGTLFLRYNDKVMRLIDKWIENTKKIHPEQKALEEALKHNPEIKVYELPRSYCYIATVRGGKATPLIPIKEPHIIHYQKSRELKRRKQ